MKPNSVTKRFSLDESNAHYAEMTFGNDRKTSELTIHDGDRYRVKLRPEEITGLRFILNQEVKP